MSKLYSIHAMRENTLLSLIATGERSLSELSSRAGFTRHHSRVRALLIELGDAGHVELTPQGRWRITDRGIARLGLETET